MLARKVGTGVALAVAAACVLALVEISSVQSQVEMQEENFYTSAESVGWPRGYMKYIDSHPGASAEDFFSAEVARAAGAEARTDQATGLVAVQFPRAQQLVYMNDNSFAGYQGLPSKFMSGGSWMDGSRGTEHLPHSVLKTLQQREAAAGIQGDDEGAENFQSGEGLDMSAGGKPVPPVQAW